MTTQTMGSLLATRINQLLIEKTGQCEWDLTTFEQIADLIDNEVWRAYKVAPPVSPDDIVDPPGEPLPPDPLGDTPRRDTTPPGQFPTLAQFKEREGIPGPKEASEEAQLAPGMVFRSPASETALMKALNKFFHRRDETPWSVKELAALKRCFPYHSDDFAALSRYYLHDHPKDKDYRRRDMQTLLNNFQGEVDRAKRWAEPPPEQPKDYSKF